jgi:hypothetical protein
MKPFMPRATLEEWEHDIARRATLAERDRIIALVRRHAAVAGSMTQARAMANFLADEIAKQPFTTDELQEDGPGIREAPK